MARAKFGLFGALFAVGGVLAWRWVQSQRDASKRATRELQRWEGEGGKVITPASASVATPVSPVRPSNGQRHGALGGTPEAWHFPHS
jgi:hypothetical protein